MVRNGWEYSVPGLEVYEKTPNPKILFSWHYNFHTSFEGDGEGTLEVDQHVDDSPGCYHLKTLSWYECASKEEAVQKIEKWITENPNVIELASRDWELSEHCHSRYDWFERYVKEHGGRKAEVWVVGDLGQRCVLRVYKLNWIKGRPVWESVFANRETYVNFAEAEKAANEWLAA